MSRPYHRYPELDEIDHGYSDAEFEPYGADNRMAARDYLELRLQPVEETWSGRDYATEAILAGELDFDAWN